MIKKNNLETFRMDREGHDIFHRPFFKTSSWAVLETGIKPVLFNFSLVGQMPEVFSVSNVTAIFGRNATLHCPFDNVADGHRVCCHELFFIFLFIILQTFHLILDQFISR